MATRRVSAILRAVTSSEIPAMRSARPSAARAHLGSDLHPADRAVGRNDSILDLEIGPRRDAGRDRDRPTVSIFRMDRGLEIAVRERLVARSPEIVLTNRRGRQFLGREVEFPDAEPASLGGEEQARGSLFLRAEPVGDLRHQGGIVGLETFEPLALDRDVDLACEEIGQPAFRVADRRHEEPVPERLAGLAVVENVRAYRHCSVDRRPDLRHRGRIGVGSLQEAAVAPQDLFARVVAQPAEGVVDEDDRVVGEPRIRDHHGHAGRSHGRRERVRTPVAARDLVDDAGRVAGIRRDARPDPQTCIFGFELAEAPAKTRNLGLSHAGRHLRVWPPRDLKSSDRETRSRESERLRHDSI